MDVFFIEKRFEEGGSVLVEALRNAMQSYLPHASLMATALARENQFFLKSSESVVWGYVFFNLPVPEDGLRIKRELAKRMETFGPFLYPCLFFPAGLSEFPFTDLPTTARYFEYFPLNAPSHKALALHEYQAPKRPLQTAVSSESPAERKVSFEGPEYRGQARLSRQELSELITLSLQLKKNPS